MLTAGSEPNTARLRLASLRAYARWLAAEDEIDDDPLIGLRPPKLTTKVTDGTDRRPSAAAAEGRAAGKTLQGPPRRSAGAAAGSKPGCGPAEVIGTTDHRPGPVPRAGHRAQRQGRQGPGGAVRLRTPPPRSTVTLRARRSHRLADTPALWLGVGGKGFGYHGLNDALRERARAAGIDGFHLHLMRHTAATRWLRAGGSRAGSDGRRRMVDPHHDRPIHRGVSASERAAAEARGLGLGDL